jgi:hypothetical protein
MGAARASYLFGSSVRHMMSTCTIPVCLPTSGWLQTVILQGLPTIPSSSSYGMSSHHNQATSVPPCARPRCRPAHMRHLNIYSLSLIYIYIPYTRGCTREDPRKGEARSCLGRYENILADTGRRGP